MTSKTPSGERCDALPALRRFVLPVAVTRPVSRKQVYARVLSRVIASTRHDWVYRSDHMPEASTAR